MSDKPLTDTTQCPAQLRALMIELGNNPQSQMLIGAVLADLSKLAGAWESDRAALAQAQAALNEIGPENISLMNQLNDAASRRDAFTSRADRAENALERARRDLAQAQAERDAVEKRAAELAKLLRRCLGPVQASGNWELDIEIDAALAGQGAEGGAE